MSAGAAWCKGADGIGNASTSTPAAVTTCRGPFHGRAASVERRSDSTLRPTGKEQRDRTDKEFACRIELWW